MAEQIKALSDAALRSLKPTGQRYEVTDKVTSSLVGRVSAQGRVTFLLRARDAANKLKTVTLGTYPQMTLKSARDEAIRTKLELKAGRDVNKEKKDKRNVSLDEGAEITLRTLVIEYEARFAIAKKTWQPRGPRTKISSARQVIQRVYDHLLDKPVLSLSDEDFAAAVNNYKRQRMTPGKSTANGQASRARAYLSPVLDWAAGRKGFSRLGSSRSPALAVTSLSTTHDPATDDPSITGRRERVLSEAELKAILPMLTYPAIQMEYLRLDPVKDFRPIAMRFLLFTAARLDEVTSMKWQDIDRSNNVWRKPSVKSTKGGVRSQALPLGEAAIGILKGLPGWTMGKPEDLVFPNGTGIGPLDNWTRFQNALHSATGTKNWHRHDLRRTAATIMHSMKVPASTIEQILAHVDPFRGENVGASASHYIQLGRALRNARDPQEEALAALAEALRHIETNND